MFLFPLFRGFLGYAFCTQVHARHVIRRVDKKEQCESNQVDTDENGNGVEYAPDNIGHHETDPRFAA